MNIIPRMLITYFCRANIQFLALVKKKAPKISLEASNALLFIVYFLRSASLTAA